MENLNAEQAIKELENQTKFAKFTNSTGVLLSAKCAQFCLDHVQYYEQRIKELAEENERLKWQNAHLECVGEVAVKNRDECEQQLRYLSNVEIPYLYEALEGKGKDADKLLDILSNALEKAKADTVREMLELIYERLDISVEGYSSEEIKSDVRDMVYQIAKEMLKEKENND